MKKIWWKPLLVLLLMGTHSTCIDPYSPNLKKFESCLVVDALITDEVRSNSVRLSRTKNSADETPEMVSGATVTLKDDLGTETILTEEAEGVYKTDSVLFRGSAGREYKLFIKTPGGEEYESESCYMYPANDIDTLYYSKDSELMDNEVEEGIRIFIDSKGDSETKYFRWTFEEWWKFSVPSPKKFNYIPGPSFIPVSPIKRTCWGHKKSYEVIIKSSDDVFSQPVLFVSSRKTNRLTTRYFVKVKQLSISKKEYEFWDCMRQITESGGDIFDKQPFQITGNIHNIKKPDEMVLGYFQVSAVKEKERYISGNVVFDLGIPRYDYECQTLVTGLEDFAEEFPVPTFDLIYSRLTSEGYIFIEPVIDAGAVTELIFSIPTCADCSLNGTVTKPDFWID